MPQQTPSYVLVTNGNAMSMLALGPWLLRHGTGLRKVYVTYKLPSAKGNLRGVAAMLFHSGWDYTYLKIWTNVLFPRRLRRQGLPASVSDLVSALGLPAAVEPVASVNTDRVVSEIRSQGVDYLVSFSATQRFRDPLIAAPRIGAVNVHYGALPAYAGLSPYFWHLHDRQPAFGVTLHRITPALDAGPIIEQDHGTTEGAGSALEVLLRMAERVSPMLCRFFEGETSLGDARPQPTEGRSYFRHPTRRQVRHFRGGGHRMVDRNAKCRATERVKALTQDVREAGRG